MNLEELRTVIQGFINNENNIGLVLYPVIAQDDNDIIRVADISDEAATELKQMILSYLQEKFISNEGLYFSAITEADDRKNAAYLYDLADRPVGLNILGEILQNGDRPDFSFNNDDFNNIKGFVITLGTEDHKIALYKRHHHLSTLNADRQFGIFKSDHRFVKMNEDIIKLSKTIDFLEFQDQLVITNLKALEDGFGYEDAIRGHATRNIAIIEEIGLLEDIAPLVEMAQDIKQAKHIMRIKNNSPVLQLPVQAVVNFVKSHRPIMNKFRLSEDGTQLRLDTQVSKKLFLSLLNDDLLTSELTKLYYAGLAKDLMEIELE